MSANSNRAVNKCMKILLADGTTQSEHQVIGKLRMVSATVHCVTQSWIKLK